jgi:hypothetical protein
MGKTKRRQSKTAFVVTVFTHLRNLGDPTGRESLFRVGGSAFSRRVLSGCRLEGTRRDAPELPPVARDLQDIVLALAVSVVLGVALDTDAGVFAGRGAAGAAHPAEGA